MAANLCRTRAMLQIPRAIPALIARTQSTQGTQTTPTAGKGIPSPGNFNSAIPPSSTGSTTTSSKTSAPNPAANQSFLNSPAVQIGAVVVVAVGIYAGYKMLSGNKEESKDSKDKKDQKDKKGQQGDEQNKSAGDQKGDKGKGNDAKK